MVSLGRYTWYPFASLFVRAVLQPTRNARSSPSPPTYPGHGQPLYALGRRLVEIIPYVPIATTLRTGISIFTYCDNVTFGITGDYDTMPDIEVLARGIERGLSELLVAAKRQHLNSGPTLGAHAVPIT